jgi:hypothetical protein
VGGCLAIHPALSLCAPVLAAGPTTRSDPPLPPSWLCVGTRASPWTC